MWPHLTLWEVVTVLVLRTFWLTPDWLLKLVAVAEAIRRFRRDSPASEEEHDRPEEDPSDRKPSG